MADSKQTPDQIVASFFKATIIGAALYVGAVFLFVL